MLDRLAFKIGSTDFSWAPAILWFLIFSPILGWALGCGFRWTWPAGTEWRKAPSKNPLKVSFWTPIG